MSSNASAPTRTAPIALWRVAEAFLHVLYNLFGAPEDVAAQHTLTAAAHKLLAAWLNAGEALMRRLLLIEAAALPNRPPALARRSISEGGSGRVRKQIGFDAEHPEAWRVSFRCLLGPPASRRRGVAAEANAPARTPAVQVRRFHSAWPLAERYEALIRVFNDPTASAQRLARRLHATPHRARALLTHPANAPDLVGHESFNAVDDEAHAARRKRFDSG